MRATCAFQSTVLLERIAFREHFSEKVIAFHTFGGIFVFKASKSVVCTCISHSGGKLGDILLLSCFVNLNIPLALWGKLKGLHPTRRPQKIKKWNQLKIWFLSWLFSFWESSFEDPLLIFEISVLFMHLGLGDIEYRWSSRLKFNFSAVDYHRRFFRQFSVGSIYSSRVPSIG